MKARQKSTRKLGRETVTVANKLLYIDTSSPCKLIGGSNKYWVMAVNAATDRVFSILLPIKTGLAGGVKKLLIQCNVAKQLVKRIRCNNARENKVPMKEVCNPFNMSIKYMAPNTPQYSRVVQQKFATIGQ